MANQSDDHALGARARNAIWASWAVITATVLMLATEIGQLLGLYDSFALSDGMATLLVGIGSFYTIAFVVSVILVAMWIHRAHANLNTHGIVGEFTPGWAVGWYFVPVANLFKPFQAMRELWNASFGQYDSYSAEAPGEVKAWWGAWIVGNIVSNVATRITGMGDPAISGDVAQASVAALLSALSSILIIVAAVLLVRLIRAITQAQQGFDMAQVFA